MKDFLKHNRAFAITCLVLLILFSVWADTALEIRRLGNKTETAYTAKGEAPGAQVKRLLAAAQGMNALGAVCGCGDAEFSAAAAALAETADSPIGQGNAADRVIRAGSTAFTQILNSAAAAAQKETARGYLREMKTAFEALSELPKYEKQAQKYNSALSSPLGSLICRKREAAADYSGLAAAYSDTYEALLASSEPSDPPGQEVLRGLWNRLTAWLRDLADKLPIISFVGTLLMCGLLVLIVVIGYRILSWIVNLVSSHHAWSGGTGSPSIRADHPASRVIRSWHR